MNTAIPAAPGTIIVGIENAGGRILLRDWPGLGWVTDETGATPPLHIIVDSLPAQWALVDIQPRRSPRELSASTGSRR
jgi:hypothetical protein